MTDPTKTAAEPAYDGEKSILDAAIAIMSRRLGRRCGFRTLLAPGESSIEIVFRPPNDGDAAGYIGATLSCAPLISKTPEQHRDLPDGNFDKATLEDVIQAIRDEFGGDMS